MKFSSIICFLAILSSFYSNGWAFTSQSHPGITQFYEQLNSFSREELARNNSSQEYFQRLVEDAIWHLNNQTSWGCFHFVRILYLISVTHDKLRHTQLVITEDLHLAINDFLETWDYWAVQENDWRSFKPQDLANMFWSFAKLNYLPSVALARAADAEVVRCLVSTNSINSFKPQGIANILRAFAELDLKPSTELLDAASLVATNSIDSFNPQNIANMLWAFAKLDLTPSAQLLNAVSLAATNSSDSR